MVFNIWKLCNTKNLDFCASLHIRSLVSGCKRHFKGLEMLTMTEISMSNANHCEIEIVTLQQLYFLSFDVAI